MNSPAVVNNDEMMTQKIALLVNEAQIQMTTGAELPKALRRCRRRKRLVEKFGKIIRQDEYRTRLESFRVSDPERTPNDFDSLQMKHHKKKRDLIHQTRSADVSARRRY